MSDRALPLPNVNRTHPTVHDLKIWAGIAPGFQLSLEEVHALNQAWRDAMRERGFVLAWIDPATMRIASRM